jgi:hypothetical protein
VFFSIKDTSFDKTDLVHYNKNGAPKATSAKGFGLTDALVGAFLLFVLPPPARTPMLSSQASILPVKAKRHREARFIGLALAQSIQRNMASGSGDLLFCQRAIAPSNTQQ